MRNEKVLGIQVRDGTVYSFSRGYDVYRTAYNNISVRNLRAPFTAKTLSTYVADLRHYPYAPKSFYYAVRLM